MQEIPHLTEELGRSKRQGGHAWRGRSRVCLEYHHAGLSGGCREPRGRARGGPPAGKAVVVFTVMPKSGLATGTAIQNQAVIVFDTNAPIATPTWLNTIDRDAPITHVLPLAATQTSPTFTVQWAGTDAGSGIG